MGKQILIIDDSMVARMFLKNIFAEKDPSWKVYDTDHAGHAAEIIQKENCDIVTVDYNMPDVNGLELANEIRQKDSNITIVVLTANIQNSLKKKVEDKGYIFLEKPITEATVDFLLTL